MNPNEILSGQSGLAGIWWALQGQPVRRKLRSTVGALLVDPACLRSFSLRRSKYKPDSRLTAYYDVHLAPSNGSKAKLRSVEVDWRPIPLNGTPAASSDELEKLKQAMQEEAVRSSIAAPFRQLAAELPQLGIRIQVYPLDASFPQLVRLSNPEYVRDALARAGLIDGGTRDQVARSHVTITPIRYRPGERHVLRFDWRGANGSAPSHTTFFAKPYDVKGEGARRMRVTNQVADWLDGLNAGVKSARVAAYLAEDETLLYPMVPGVPLSQALRSPDGKVAQSLSLAGTAMRTLHDSPNTLIADLPLKTLESEIKVVLRASQHIHVLLPEVGANIVRIANRIQELHGRLPAEPPTFTHSDFKADHLRLSGKAMTLIDFDTCSLADPASDIGKFLADLRFWHEVYGRAGAEQSQRQFLDGYGLGDSEARLLRGYLYETLILTKIAIRRVPLFDRHWATRTAELIDCSGQLLGVLSARIGGQP